ncbi:unnamed protein product [Clonostachys rosea]|uniref:F-box domain-containing protein n=1 Tax=Bionectria ochroleuca TaxID=29856 RepID=A0ABY6UR65_BIOOC|nr:unnamed protein product [Clonostachys rosea]
MSDNGGTENLGSSFERLPTETLWKIASFCNHWDIVALASTSSGMRFKVLPLVHKKGSLLGRQYSLRQQLTDFLGHKPSVDSRVYTTIRSSAAIAVQERPHDRGLWTDLYLDTAPNQFASQLPSRIFAALQAMPNLRSLSL